MEKYIFYNPKMYITCISVDAVYMHMTYTHAYVQGMVWCSEPPTRNCYKALERIKQVYGGTMRRCS
jgi:hypothetical protein